MRRVLAALLGLAVAPAVAATPAWASHQNGHIPPPGPAMVAFAKDFPRLTDTEWGFPLGGFGGTGRGAARTHVPVIFVHGNNVDHADWYLVRNDFLAAGWTMQELYGISYNGLGSESGNTTQRDNPEGRAERQGSPDYDGIGRIANNDISGVPDLQAFILAVRAYTGSAKFSIVSHSLGVTVARQTLKAHPELRKDLVAFVGIAGGNHGTSLCPPGSEGRVYACDEVAAGTPWLDALNGPGGADETYAPAKWMTIYDGGGVADGAFAGTYAKSPALRGADNREFPNTAHNMLRVREDIVALYRSFLEEAEKPILAPPRPSSPPAAVKGVRRELPATGVPARPALVWSLAIAAAGALAMKRRGA